MSSTTDCRLARVFWLTLLLSLGAAAPASALLFEAIEVEGIGWVLVARDCPYLRSDVTRGCDGWERGFNSAGAYPNRAGARRQYHGDPAELVQQLNRRRYAEVWLISGGGSLQAGIEMGRILRRRQMTVRVPADHRCISACTVAFMGGYFRFVDPGATYEVHSASWVSSGVSSADRSAAERGDFQQIARFHRVAARRTARQLLTHFQNALSLPLRVQQPEDDREFRIWADDLPARPYYSREQARQDSLRIANEGLAAVQDVIMRIEREMMHEAIADLRDLVRADRLGPRAEPALRMLEAMYDVSIRETAVLTRETMLRMGYITEELPTHRRN